MLQTESGFDPQQAVDAYAAGKSIIVPASLLTEVEDALVHGLLPMGADADPEILPIIETNWRNRERLIDLMRGKKFLGNIGTVELHPIEEPYEALLTAGKLHGKRQSPELAQLNTLGFYAIASELSSSRQQNLGTLVRPVWLLRNSPNTTKQTWNLWRRIVGKDQGNNDIEQSHKASVGNPARGSQARSNTSRQTSRRISYVGPKR